MTKISKDDVIKQVDSFNPKFDPETLIKNNKKYADYKSKDFASEIDPLWKSVGETQLFLQDYIAKNAQELKIRPHHVAVSGGKETYLTKDDAKKVFESLGLKWDEEKYAFVQKNAYNKNIFNTWRMGQLVGLTSGITNAEAKKIRPKLWVWETAAMKQHAFVEEKKT